MKKTALSSMIELTRECITRFWQRDVEFVIQYFDDEITWIGSAQSQFMKGREAAEKDFRSIRDELIECHLLRQEFSAIMNKGSMCVITGRYLTTADDETRTFLQAEQRCTFIWDLINGEPKIKHIHVSNPLGELALADGERVPNALGEQSKKYWLYMLEAAKEDKRIALRSVDGALHIVAPAEILRVQAEGRSSVIHTIDGKTITSRMCITELKEFVGEGFTSIHRSHFVNDRYIAYICHYKIVMSDGAEVPVPVKRYAEVYNELMSKYKNRKI